VEAGGGLGIRPRARRRGGVRGVAAGAIGADAFPVHLPGPDLRVRPGVRCPLRADRNHALGRFGGHAATTVVAVFSLTSRRGESLASSFLEERIAWANALRSPALFPSCPLRGPLLPGDGEVARAPFPGPALVVAVEDVDGLGMPAVHDVEDLVFAGEALDADAVAMIQAHFQQIGRNGYRLDVRGQGIAPGATSGFGRPFRFSRGAAGIGQGPDPEAFTGLGGGKEVRRIDKLAEGLAVLFFGGADGTGGFG